MNIETFFKGGLQWDKMPLPDQGWVQEQIDFIKKDPTPFVLAAIRARLDHGHITKDFVLGILVGYAASDDRVKFKEG